MQTRSWSLSAADDGSQGSGKDVLRVLPGPCFFRRFPLHRAPSCAENTNGPPLSGRPVFIICGPPQAPETQKAPDALASGACMPWWSCVNKNHTFYTINSKCYIFVKIGIPTKIPTLYFHAMEQMPPVPLLSLHPGLALASPSSVSPPPERSSFPAGVGLPGPQPVLRGRNEIALSVFLLGLALHAALRGR